MNEANLQSLRDEYSALSSLIEKYWITPYNIIPIAVTGIGALAVYGESNKSFVGVLIGNGMVLLVAWWSYVHALMNSVGLRLAELECRINIAAGVNNEEGIRWNSHVIGNGNQVVPGMWLTTVIVFVLAAILFLGASYLGCSDLQRRNVLPPAGIVVVVAIPGILLVALLASIVRVEKKIRREKQTMLQRLRSSPAP